MSDREIEGFLRLRERKGLSDQGFERVPAVISDQEVTDTADGGAGQMQLLAQAFTTKPKFCRPASFVGA